MGTAKRERQKAGRQARLQQAQAVEARKKRTRFAAYGIGLVIVIIVALFALAPDGDDDDVTATGSDGSSTSSTASTTPGETVATVQVTVPPVGETLTGETPCPEADGSSPRTTTFAAMPPTCIDATKTYTAEVLTTEGPFTLELDPTAAPLTVNSFVVLARYHYYDGVTFHRIIPGFMVQTGDAVGPSPGVGGPGYTIPDELPTGEDPYPEGSLAMANTGQPDSGGSQWFVTVADGGSQLTPSYTRFGSVTAGIEVVRQINNFGDAASNGTPTQEVVIESITITES
jgi:cyclophilin family peptidyl-prolyl cis-trans isomerase